MFEIWPGAPDEIFRLAKYLLGPAGVALFVVFAPVLLAVPASFFRPLLLAVSIGLLAFSWGPSFSLLLIGSLALGYPLVRYRPLSGVVGFLLVEALYVSLFLWPLEWLPVLRDARFAEVYPGLLTDRELVFYTGLAFTNLRYLHLALGRSRGQDEELSFGRYLLYLLYAPTYRLGPFTPYGHFEQEVRTARSRQRWTDIRQGLGEVLLGALIFEVVIKALDAWYFKPIASVDDGSYWYQAFFDAPPQSAWLTLLGIYLLALRYYLLIKAYSHVAAGASRIVGIRLPANMRWPLLSRNLIEFWRRYHVSVSQFVMQHVLDPVGRTAGRPALAVVAAFLFMAMWHRPAVHTTVWALLQVAGVAVVFWWRRQAVCSPAVAWFRRSVPAAVRRVGATVMTLGFVAHTVPILLDVRHGALKLIERLLSGDWSLPF
jgi:alginate O-acetyltransferase complex protein AlgI